MQDVPHELLLIGIQKRKALGNLPGAGLPIQRLGGTDTVPYHFNALALDTEHLRYREAASRCMCSVMIDPDELARRLYPLLNSSADIGQSQRSLPVVQGIPNEFVFVDYSAAFNKAMLGKGKRSMGELALVVRPDFLLCTAFFCPGNHLIGLMAELRSDRPM